MAIIQGDGYKYDTNSRKIIFETQVCWNCEGEKEIKRGISCPNWGQNCHGKPCPHCGSKNKHSHKIIGWKTVPCYTCNATGETQSDVFSSHDFRPLLGEISFELFNGNQTFSDAYLGIGNFAGVTGYTRGKYSTIEACMKTIRERLKHIQAGNLFDSDGFMPEKAYIKSCQNGCSFHAFFVTPVRFSH